MHYSVIFTIQRLWIIFGVSMLLMFSTLLFFGGKVYQDKPPIPTFVKSSQGEEIYTKKSIEKGQNIWQSLGGMQRGSIWGHGSYLAPDWSADWLHREVVFLLNQKAVKQYSKKFKSLNEIEKDILIAQNKNEFRSNTYSSKTGVITLSEGRAKAVKQTQAHYETIFKKTSNDTGKKLRENYAFSKKLNLSDEEVHDLSAFFFWTAWAASTNRPNDVITYTSNWPHEPLIDNKPTSSLFLWSILSIAFLLIGIGVIVWFYAKQYDNWRNDIVPSEGVSKVDLFSKIKPTPSMKATAKYFWIVIILFAFQVLLGVITAHYTVEGQAFFGIPLAEVLPYTVTRTWHTQLPIFWIATAWLAAGLYFAPLISGHEPKFQRFGVNFLFVCLLIIVVGSFTGEWLGVNQFFSNLTTNFWFGHQGYEYVDLGRFWQIFLAIGLLLWLVLIVRALLPAIKTENSQSLIWLLLISSAAIGLLYFSGLMWGQNTHISVMEYWRWWVVHLWVEGVFEVFATTIVSYILVKMGLLRSSTAVIAVLFASIIFLCGGVLGTFHHLYFSGTPVGVMALGAVFSALEVVPLVVVGFEAYTHAKIERQVNWYNNYHWPFMFLGAVLFWNLFGAGVLGFLINPPIALYYMQGLNTTATHGHAALFGVYGMLGIGLMLICLKGLTDKKQWDDYWLKLSFWSFNIGLLLMLILSLLPIGLLQTYQSYTNGYYAARSAEYMHSDLIEWLVWFRVPGDIIFGFGVLCFIFFIYKLYFGKQKI